MADRYGVTMRTLRFYEEKGFLRPRRVGNRRAYGDMDQRRMAVISKGKEMGFSLEDVCALIEIVESKMSAVDKAKAMRELCNRQLESLRSQLSEISSQISATSTALVEIDTLATDADEPAGRA
ncbi:MAG: MerR family transcriptional regulator [Hyphomicrobiaceae bacterium]|nr:MerR family transcriptional regulator [Hyphomicrobiaceae bacterium]